MVVEMVVVPCVTRHDGGAGTHLSPAPARRRDRAALGGEGAEHEVAGGGGGGEYLRSAVHSSSPTRVAGRWARVGRRAPVEGSVPHLWGEGEGRGGEGREEEGRTREGKRREGGPP